MLEGELAAGGMARVYLATLRGAGGFEKRLVVKKIRAELASDEAFVQRFVEEAKTAVELSHPNIVPVYELGSEEGVYYIAMEFCDGVSLAELLRSAGSLTPEEGAYVGIEICRALDYAHRRSRVVHRDVTPRNVLIDDEGAVRLIDFGIAAPVTLDGERSDIFGSPGHMPPEQISGGTLSPATDVFAAAALLIEVWTGKPPFRRATPKECLEALEQPPPRIDQAFPALEPLAELISNAVAANAGTRPQTTEELSRPLREFVKSTDLGDLAKRLGRRVREAKGKGGAGAKGGAMLASHDLVTPPSGGQTQTFAARNEVQEWTRKIETDPGQEEATSDSERIDDIAAEPSRRSWGLPAALIVGGLAVGWVAARSLPELLNPPLPPSARSAFPLPAPSAAITTKAATLRTKPRKSPSAQPHRAVPTGVLSPGVQARAPASSGAFKPAYGFVSLTSQPATSVSVNGRSYGTTPVVNLELPRGSYAVVFSDPILGRVSASLKLGVGEKRGVHADLTAATPRVFVR